MAPSRSSDIAEVPNLRYTGFMGGDPQIDLEKVREFLRGKREQRIRERHALRARAQREARAIIERVDAETATQIRSRGRLVHERKGNR